MYIYIYIDVYTYIYLYIYIYIYILKFSFPDNHIYNTPSQLPTITHITVKKICTSINK